MMNKFVRIAGFIVLMILCVTDVYAQPPGNTPGGDRRAHKVHGQFTNHKPRKKLDTTSCTSLVYRSLDGTCNNIANGSRMEWGASDIRFARDMPAVYGTANPASAMGGENRVSAREVSNKVIDQPSIIFSQYNLSAMVYNWGQFLDHDITLAPEIEYESEPIVLPADETLMTVDIPFHRSEYYNEANDPLPREQINILTAWVDGSQVYGVDSARVDWLRSKVDGKLKVSAGDFLPFNTVDGEYASAIDTTAPSTAGGSSTVKMWVAGDVRAGEQPGLTALHTIFVREHNRICDELIAGGMSGDDSLYFEARKKVINIIQKITYKEFIPSLGLSLSNYNGYNSSVNPNITNIFAAAAFRIGHTMVVDSVRLFDNDCNPTGDTVVSLAEGFFNPDVILNNGLDPFVKGITVEVQYEIDPYIVDELRDFLFTSSTSPIVAGLDLAALNIQRGRDHGLPDYNSIRTHYTGTTATTMADISSVSRIQDSLNAACTDINDIDAWAGLVAEDRVAGTSLGPTMHAILSEQFERLRDGDRFYYERPGYLTTAEKTEVDATTLAMVIERNTSLTGLATDVMYSQSCFPTSTSNAKKLSDLRIGIVPNPSNGIFNIHVPNQNLIIQNITIYTAQGKKVNVAQQDKTQVDLTNYPTGMYFVHFETDAGSTTRKIIKE